jgi:urease accessory protein
MIQVAPQQRASDNTGRGDGFDRSVTTVGSRYTGVMRDDAPAGRIEADSQARQWRASLALAFAREGERTVLTRREHYGPLRVQKALYPEGPGLCQCIVVHPPGGIAGGDALALDIDVGANAQAQLTTPGATKWYRTAGPAAQQSTSIKVASRGMCEWLPQGTIYFCGTKARVETVFTLAVDATLLAWDIGCLGRSASGERFVSGRLHQRSEIVRDGALIWSERLVLDGDSALLRAAAGLNGNPVFGTFVAASEALDAEIVDQCRRVVPDVGDGAISFLTDVLVARFLGPSLEAGHDYFAALWKQLRPRLAARHAVTPRIWQT